jgi:hypothetical protein
MAITKQIIAKVHVTALSKGFVAGLTVEIGASYSVSSINLHCACVINGAPFKKENPGRKILPVDFPDAA